LGAAAAAFDRRGADLGLSAASLDAIAVPVLRGDVVPVNFCDILIFLKKI
jgi:hypothetical protein